LEVNQEKGKLGNWEKGWFNKGKLKENMCPDQIGGSNRNQPTKGMEESGGKELIAEPNPEEKLGR
jgi:hypothetical protein